MRLLWIWECGRWGNRSTNNSLHGNETGWDRVPLLQSCNAYTWIHLSSRNKIQINHMGLKIALCMCRWGKLWTKRYQEKKKRKTKNPNFCFWSEVKVTQLCSTLCHPMDYIQSMEFSRPEYWVALLFSRGSSQPRDRTQVSHLAGRLFTSWATREASS